VVGAQSAHDDISTTGLSGLRILLAEDNEFNAMVAQGHLENWLPGAQLTHVLNGALAVEAVREGTSTTSC
jgi:CheY-like chemotaxis protein